MATAMVTQPPASGYPTRTAIDGKLLAMAQYLKQRAARDPRWGASFIRALDRGLAYQQEGLTVERYNAGYWVAPSASREFVRHFCNRWACDCEAFAKGNGQWCWHRAMLLLHTIEAEFDAVHGLSDEDEDYEPEPDCQPSYRLIRELRN